MDRARFAVTGRPSYGESMRPSTMLTMPFVGALLAGTVAAAPAPAQAAAPAQYAGAAERTTNTVRARHDRVRLRDSACLARYAGRQADRMAARGEIFHQDLQPVLRACHLSSTGENVAYGFSSGRSVVKQGWMRSPGHRENILRREYRLMAVGAERGRDGRWYVAQLFGRR